jgi:hypothetical protein
MRYEHRPQRDPDSVLADYLDEARCLLAAAPLVAPPGDQLEVTADFEQLRWFTLPHEVTADPVS